MRKQKFNIRLFIFLFIGFVIATVVGTVSHEFGHYAVAKYLGYNSSISYGQTGWDDEVNSKFIDSTHKKYSKEIQLGLDFPEKKKFDKMQKKLHSDNFWITLGGPLQTMLIGTFGLTLIFLYRKKFNNAKTLSFGQWLIIFLSLFWLRQSANLVTWIIGYFLKGHFSLNGDEINLAFYFGLPMWTIATITAIIGFIVLAFIIFKIIPPANRLTFILAGFFGGCFGYFFWLYWVGPILLP